MSRLSCGLSVAFAAVLILLGATPILAHAGDLDCTFGNGGVALHSGGGAFGVGVQSTQNIVIVGNAGSAPQLMRFTPTGALDTTFGTAGVANPAITGASASTFSMAVDSQDRIIVGGLASIAGVQEAFVARYTPDGALDSSFNGTGWLAWEWTGTPATDRVNDVAVDLSDRVIAGGTSDSTPQTGSSIAAVARITSSGTLDSTFGTGGVYHDAINASVDSEVRGVAVQPDGKVLAVGPSGALLPSVRMSRIFRLTASGVPDTGFNTTGFNTVDFSRSGTDNYSFKVRVDSVGRAVMLGVISSPNDQALARFTTAGALDSTFGTSGILQVNINGQDAGEGGLALQSDDKILVGTYTAASFGFQMAAYRATTAGALDSTFGSGGKVLTDFNLDRGYAVTVQGDGRILVSGWQQGSNSNEVVRYLNDTDDVTTVTTITGHSPSPSLAGQAVTVTYTVTNSHATPTGNVTVSDGVNSCTATVAAGTCTLSLTTIGTRTLTATYAGSSPLFCNSSGSVSHDVVNNTTTTSITAHTPNPSTVGSPVSVSVTVAALAGTPSGSVSISDNAGASCTATLSAGSGSCSFTPTTGGTRNITAAYAGDGTYLASSTTASHTFDAVGTTTSITGSSPNPSPAGSPLTVSAQVTSTFGTPTGSVTIDDGNGATCNFLLSAGSGSCNLIATATGTRTITASYAGTSTYLASSGTTSHTFSAAQTFTTISSHTPNPSTVGSSISVTASVTSGAGTPTGTVTIDDGAGANCTATLSSGIGTCSLTPTVTGTRSLTATYNATTDFLSSAGTAQQTINSAPSTTTITSDSPDPSVIGTAVNVAVMVTSAFGTPGGTVDVSDGAGATCSISLVSGAGNCNLTPTSGGTRNITANYSGDSTHLSSSATEGHTFSAAATTTVITSDTPDPSTIGTALSVAVSVSSSFGTPAGTVTISDGAGASCIATLAAGSGSCSITPTVAGARNITADYAGSTDYQSSSAGEAHTFSTAATTTTITSDSPDPSPVGSPLTVGVSVTSSFGTPAGTVTVDDGAGATCIATLSGGTGSCNLTATATGSRNITATYSGSATHSASSATEAHTFQPTISIADAIAPEGNSGTSNMTFTVTLSGSSPSQVTVDYTTADGTAVAPDDYIATSGTLTFDPGTTTQTIAVPIVGDVLAEGNENFSVHLSNATNAAIRTADGQGTIVDDEGSPALTINDVTVTEGNGAPGTATFTVVLAPASSSTVTVDYATADGTADAGSDYTATSGTLTFPANTTSQTITVPILSDTTAEPTENFAVNLTSPSGATLAKAQGTGTILDDDGTPTLTINDVTVPEGNSGTTNATFTVHLSPASSQTVTVDFATADVTATAGSDYTAQTGTLTFAPGEVSKTISVPIIGDTVIEGNETFVVNLSSPVNASVGTSQGTGTIADDDGVASLSIGDTSVTEGNSGTTNAIFTVTLSGTSSQTVTVNYATSDGTAAAGSDYTATSGTLTFPPGTTTQTLSVPVIGDTLVEGNEFFNVTLNNATNANIGDSLGLGTIIDDDVAAPQLPSLSIGDATVAEGNAGTTNAVFNVVLSGTNAAGVTVHYATADGSATAGADYTATSGTLTFPPGVNAETISVPVIGDVIVEGNETFSVTLSAPVNASLAVATGTGTILDDDTAPTTPNTSRLSVDANVQVAECTNGAGSTALFTIHVSPTAATQITVDYQTMDGTAVAGSDYVATSGVLHISAGASSATIPVQTICDDVPEGDETFFLVLSNASAGTLSNAIGAATISDGTGTSSQPQPARAFLAVVGATPGAHGSFFRTSIRLFNPTDQPISGTLIVHPAGQPGSSSDPSVPYSLLSHQSQLLTDLPGSLGLNGLGSADVAANVGDLPILYVRIYNDGGAEGTSGFVEQELIPAQAIPSGKQAVLFAPADLKAYRLNIGVRSLESGATFDIAVLDDNGVQQFQSTRSLPADYFVQMSAADFVGTPLHGGETIMITVRSGSLIAYGAATDNVTNDPSVQFARVLP